MTEMTEMTTLTKLAILSIVIAVSFVKNLSFLTFLIVIKGVSTTMSNLDNLILKQHYGIHWRRKYPQVFDIDCMLEQIKCGNKLNRIDSKQLVKKNRIALILSITDIINGSEGEAYVDIITGMPSLEQFLDTTYGPGLNANLRIIVYDSISSDDYASSIYPEDYQQDIRDLVILNNKCGLSTYLVNLESTGPILYYTSIESPHAKPSKTIFHLPNKRLVQEAFFWRHSFIINYPNRIEQFLTQIPIMRIPINSACKSEGKRHRIPKDCGM